MPIKSGVIDLLLFILLCANFISAQTNQPKAAAPTPGEKNLPAVFKNGLRNEMHARLDVLTGDWNVEQETYYLGKKLEKPLRSNNMTCRREWIEGPGEKRFLRDETTGKYGDSAYYRLGILGYSTMDRRYEWNTIDGMNANMMTYKGKPGSASPTGEISMEGEFTDQGILGDAYVGKSIFQRTVIRIETPDRHVFDIYFRPPGEKEILIVHGIYTRRK
jgi:hypothetical protein